MFSFGHTRKKTFFYERCSLTWMFPQTLDSCWEDQQNKQMLRRSHSDHFWSESLFFISFNSDWNLRIFDHPTMFFSKAKFHSHSASFWTFTFNDCPTSTSLYEGVFQIKFTGLKLSLRTISKLIFQLQLFTFSFVNGKLGNISE